MNDSRIKMVFKAMINALLGKVEDPQMMLDQTYAELQSALISGRQKLANLLAIEAQLKVQIERLEKVETQVKEALVSGEKSESELGELKLKLRKVQHEIAELKRILSELEDDLGNAYTTRQILIAREKAAQATLMSDEVLVGKAITEEGFTYDYEISRGSERAPKDDIPGWLLILIVVAAAILLVIWWQATHS
jgi:Phage shock protein A (IM30), suppresses sigma54-dependent transcription